MKLLVYSNGSPESVQALHFGAHLARTLDCDLAVITVRSGTHAVEPAPPFGQDVDLADGRNLPAGMQILTSALEVLCAEGLLERQGNAVVRLSELPSGQLFICRSKTGKRIPFYVCYGSLVETLHHEIDQRHYDLLVIAPPSRGRLRKMVLGDTTRKLVLDLHTSVLFVRGGGPQSRYVVCADGSAASRRQSGMLRRLLPSIGPPVEIVWVKTPDVDAAAVEAAEHCLDKARQWMINGGKTFKILRLEGGRPAEVICAAAGEDAVMLLAASLRHDVYRRLMGSLPMQVLARTKSSVLLVKGLPEGDPDDLF